jgi:hypothetical protein
MQSMAAISANVAAQSGLVLGHKTASVSRVTALVC